MFLFGFVVVLLTLILKVETMVMLETFSNYLVVSECLYPPNNTFQSLAKYPSKILKTNIKSFPGQVSILVKFSLISQDETERGSDKGFDFALLLLNSNIYIF